MSQFTDHISRFNTMYRMPVSGTPTLPTSQRLVNFKSILSKELDEINEIIEKLELFEQTATVDSFHDSELEILTLLADLLGDLQVYCASEMAKCGLPLEPVLDIIMQSNFSKMGADGKPIYDGQGKLQKGPNYWKPEPKLAALLKAALGRGS